MLEKFKLVKRIEIPALAKWELTRCIASSNWSDVFRARPATQSRARHQSEARRTRNASDDLGDYVVKIAKRSESKELAAQLLTREAYIARSVSHANLVSILDYGLKSDPCFIVQPFLDGTNLKAMIKSRSLPSTAYSLWMLRQIADGLAALHENSIVHCDLSPGNIMISPLGHATLIDFGLAQLPKTDRLPMQHLAGTVDYLAPEQLDANTFADIPVDVYALGCIAFELLAGRPASRNQDRAPEKSLLQQTLKHLVNMSAANLICDLLISMLDVQPQSRPTAQAVSQSLWQHEINIFGCRAA